MAKSFDGAKLLVKKASAKDIEWLHVNHEKFTVPLHTPQTSEAEYHCLVLKAKSEGGSQILGYLNYEMPKGGGNPEIHGISIRKGYERGRLGRFLVGQGNAFLNAGGHSQTFATTANMHAKNFYANKVHGTVVEGFEATERGFSKFSIPTRRRKLV